jgi:hypothetical protein
MPSASKAATQNTRTVTANFMLCFSRRRITGWFGARNARQWGVSVPAADAVSVAGAVDPFAGIFSF